jgi:hypothetical protein
MSEDKKNIGDLPASDKELNDEEQASRSSASPPTATSRPYPPGDPQSRAAPPGDPDDSRSSPPPTDPQS